MSDIKWLLVQLLDDRWKTSNAEKPEITDESFDEELNVPQLCLPSDDENTQGGSFYAMSGTDGGPIQRVSGEVTGGIWATAESVRSITAGRNPKTWLSDAKEEAARVILDNTEALAGLEYIAWNGGHDQHETDREPTIYRRVILIGYEYLRGR